MAPRNGVTNPEPINGNTGLSLSADDDGGFFRSKAAAYYATGPLPLAGAGGPPGPARRTAFDHDGDGRADVAVYRQATGEWFLRRSSDGGLTHLPWGAPMLSDRPFSRPTALR